MNTGRKPGEGESKDSGVVSVSQVRPKIASKPPEARGRHETDSFPQRSEGTNPVQTLILDFCFPKLGDNIFLLFKPLSCNTVDP